MRQNTLIHRWNTRVCPVFSQTSEKPNVVYFPLSLFFSVPSLFINIYYLFICSTFRLFFLLWTLFIDCCFVCACMCGCVYLLLNNTKVKCFV